MTQINSIDDILNNSDFDDILVPDPIRENQTKTEDQRLVDSFIEINEFIRQNGHEPSLLSKDINERKLQVRLENFKQSQQKTEYLKDYDEFKLLPEFGTNNKALDNSISSEKEEDLDIFKIQNIPVKNRQETDFVARRKPCKDFDRFEPLFKDCHQKLKNGDYKLVKFSEEDIQKNTFFVVNGVLALVVDLHKLTQDKNSKTDGRTRIIFENGLESNMKFRSFGKALFTNGKSIVPNIQTEIISSENTHTGYLYILKSLSTNPEISSIQHLYKIGYATSSVEERIKNAKTDPTYLNSEVKIVATFQTIDLNPQKLENLLHRFFADSCLNILIDDGKGGKLKPREWFIVPIEVITETIKLITNGNIVNYRYDNQSEKLVLL